MAKLHELIAAESNLSGQSESSRNGLKSTFDKKRHLFESKIKAFSSSEEGGKQGSIEEQSDIQTSVTKELDWLKGIMVKAMDASYQIDMANCTAKADLVIDEDGEQIVLVKGMPTTALMAMEHEVKFFQDVLHAIPTLDPAKGFTPDTQKGEGVYQARPVVTTRTRKEKKVLRMAPPTDKHPEQVAVYDADVPIGEVRTMEWSSLISPADKSDLLNRADILIRAIRKARARANEAEVDQSAKIGATLLNYVLRGASA